MSANALFRPTFADLRAELERRAAQGAPAEELDTLVEGFLALGGDTPAPWVEYDGTVTWLYRDSQATGVSVVGDMLGRAPDQNRMTRLPGGDMFALTAQLPLDARIAYAFEVDIDGRPRQHRADPLNPKRMVAAAPLRALSILEMPNARRVPQLDDGPADDGVGVIYQVVASADQATWARVWVFLPPGYDPDERRYPTLYLDGGESYLLSGRAAQIVDALQLQGEVVPLLAVFVQRDDAGYAPEQGLDARYVGFLADELVPWVDAHYATSTDPQERVIGGAGAGGALALYAALERPDAFGRTLAQSPIAGALPGLAPDLLLRNAGRGFGPPHCYVDVGRYEPPAQLDGVHSLCAALLGEGAVVSYQDFGGDHSFVSWRTTLPDALRFHFGAPPLPAL